MWVVKGGNIIPLFVPLTCFDPNNEEPLCYKFFPMTQDMVTTAPEAPEAAATASTATAPPTTTTTAGDT